MERETETERRRESERETEIPKITKINEKEKYIKRLVL